MQTRSEHTKYCQRGDHVLVVAEFHKNRAKPDGLADWCKACTAHYHRERVYGGKLPRPTMERLKQQLGITERAAGDVAGDPHRRASAGNSPAVSRRAAT